MRSPQPASTPASPPAPELELEEEEEEEAEDVDAPAPPPLAAVELVDAVDAPPVEDDKEDVAPPVEEAVDAPPVEEAEDVAAPPPPVEAEDDEEDEPELEIEDDVEEEADDAAVELDDETDAPPSPEARCAWSQSTPSTCWHARGANRAKPIAASEER